MKKTIFLISAIVMILTFETFAASPNSLDLPSLLTSVKNMDALSFCGEKVPIKNQEVLERLEKELLLTLGDRPQVILWLKRSRRYLP